MIQKLTQEDLKSRLRYSPETGEWLWAISTQKLRAGTPAGSRDKDNYLKVFLFGKYYSMATLAYLYMEGKFPPEGYIVDHIDTNPFNDKYDNYRLATHIQNVANSKLSVLNSSGIKGLVENKLGQLQARIMCNGQLYTRRFKKDEVEQAKEWLRITRENLHGEFTNHGSN